MYKMNRDDLEELAKMKVCTCYYYDLVDTIDSIPDGELRLICDTPYYSHVVQDDDLTECPEYMAEKAETIRDGLREDGIVA